MFGGHHNFALHQTASRIFGIGQRLFHRQTFNVIQGIKNGGLLWFFQILKQVNDIIAVEITHRFGQNFRFEVGDDFFANPLFEFRKNITIKFQIIKLDECAPVCGINLFQHIRDVGRMQRFHQGDKRIPITRFNRI